MESMNAAYVHLTLNHVPVLGVVFALPLLGFGLLRRNPALLRAGWLVPCQPRRQTARIDLPAR